MPRESKGNQLAKRDDPAAPFLFDVNNIPVRTDVLKAVQDKRYTHTGARLMEDEELALKVVEKLMHGTGVKKIADALNISPHTIRAARRELEKQGKLAPYKQRISEKFADIIEAGAEKYLDAVEGGLVPAAQIPIGLGIFSDKKALLDGTPTAIVAQAEDKEAMVAKLDSFLAKLPKATVIDVPTDSESSGNTTKGQ